MEHWQFLIQKQGDRSWHILESPNLQILEGQYRVLARSSLRNTDVEVRVTHFSIHEATPKRRIFKRSRRTNPEGLMAVIPFTYFEPGVWELRCSGDLMSDMLGKSWQYSVQLQILSQTGEQRAGGDERGKGEVAVSFFPLPPISSIAHPLPDASYVVEKLDRAIAISTELPIPTDSSADTIVVPDATKQEDTASSIDAAVISYAIKEEDTASSIDTAGVPNVTEEDIASSADSAVVSDTSKKEDTAIDQPISPVWLKGETVEQILQNLIELALPTAEPLSEDEKDIDSSKTQQLSPLLLTLDRDTYIACWGQALTINGHVELKEKTNLELAERLSPKSIRGLELKIELRSPLESQILTQVRRPLPDQDLPFTINTSIDIPADCESKLILADISLYGRFTEISEVTLLAAQSFTITADVTELLTITAAAKSSTFSNEVIAPSASSGSFLEPQATIKLDLKLLNLVKLRTTDQPSVVNPSPNTPLPPQINLQDLREATLRTSQLKNSANSPQLPKLPPIQSDANTPADVVAESPTQNELLEKDATIAAINLEQLVIRQRRIPILDTTLPYLKRLQTVSSATEEVKDNALDISEIQAAEGIPQLDTIITEDQNTTQVLAQPNLEVQEESVAQVLGQPNLEFQEESVAQVLAQPNLEFQEESVTQVLAQPNLEFQEESVAQVLAQPNLEFQEESVVQVLAQPNSEFQEESVAQVLAQPNSEFIKAKLYSSPLLRKWMQSQGYSLPESINELPSQGYDNYLPAQQTPLSFSAETPNDDIDLVDANLLLSLDANTEILEDTDTVEKADLVIQENTVVEKILEEPTFSPPLLSQIPPPPPPINRNTASAWLAQEIVVDDTYSELEAHATEIYALEEEEQAASNLSRLLPITTVDIEPLPIPQLHVPEGELIAGKSVIVRVVMPEVPRQVAIKLWVEDCQTRWLLDGPHLLTNLIPNTSGGLEVMTQLNIPFGCLEIRLEAIALDRTTQQESHKVTIVRTVIPPDLPNLELDELLGI
ncbi:MAG: hypothetical protein RMX65_000955 [Nostoc sp. DedQUE01]|nr:hypothetical protein [Nostoc sp. DedQUE01]